MPKMAWSWFRGRWSARPVLALLLLLVVLLLLLRGLWPPQPPTRLAITSFPPYNYFYLATRVPQAGDDRLKLVLRQYSSLEDQRRAFDQGAVDAIATTLPEALAICQEAPERCPQIVLVLDESAGADQLVSQASIVHPQDLKGRRVGLEHSVLAEYILLRSLEGSEVGLKELGLRYRGPQELVEELRRGELDAVVSYAPYVSQLQGDPRFRVLFDSRQMPGEVVDVLAVEPGFARRHPQQVTALIRSWWAARAYAADHPSESVALMAKREQITPQDFLAFEALVRYPGPAEQHTLLSPQGPLQRALQRMARQMQQADRVRSAPTLPSSRADYLPVP